ncbi:MAG: endonuclease MutS2, partial [Sphaerochaetaceae bacterium]|nr:endonuclease MutS2 [Sphaerochaetaceae bacterium]
MFKRTAEDLGLDIVLKNISSYALSEEGSSLVQKAIPVHSKESYFLRQEQVRAMIFALSESTKKDIHLETFPNISTILYTLDNNPTSSLKGESVYDVALFIRSARLLKQFIELTNLDYCPSKNSGINEIFNNIPDDVLYLENEIFKILESPGQVKENYPTIKALKEKAENKRAERTKIANDFMRNYTSIMNSDNAVLRDGRIVLPVRNEEKSKLEGYVQSTSSSGNTIFMEPFKLIDMNNGVILAQQEIEIEKARLIGSLTSMIRECIEDLRLLSSKISKIDFLYAFSQWVRINNCCKTHIGSFEIEGDYAVNLIGARHPLLGSKCVPIDLIIPSNYKAVVITGPNAGGKTVTMKTVGLFALLNQICGYIPANDGSSLALFDRVFTDIGDDQSIENHLSTFSGHMKSIGFILRSLTKGSLIILDELGSGTDPQEGAALARSILEYCNEKAALTM